MHLYLGLAIWGVVAFVIYKAINYVLARRQWAGKSTLHTLNILNDIDSHHSQSKRHRRL